MSTDRPDLHLSALSSVAALIDQVDDTVVGLVAEARAHHATWEDIGFALGISRQAAHYRYARLLAEPKQLELPVEAKDVPAP